MRYQALLIACLLWPSSALPVTWSGMASKIPGVELLSISKDDSGAYVGLLDGQSKEFQTYCARGGTVHVSGFKAPVKCQMDDRDIQGDFFEIRLVTKEPLQGSGLFVMSKKAIPPRMPLVDFTPEESEMLKAADQQFLASSDKASLACYQGRYKEMDENTAEIDRRIGRAVKKRTTTYKQDHESYVRKIKSSALYKKFIGKKFKLSGPNGFIYISSIGLDSCDLMGWDIENVVYVLENDKLVEMTRFFGCIEGGFRDLNGDGAPEVLTLTCENGESMHYAYWTIYPKAEVLLRR